MSTHAMMTTSLHSGSVPPSNAPFSYVPGNRFDRFEIVEQYRYGAFKEVYLAKDVEHDLGGQYLCVLKVVKSLDKILDTSLMAPAGTATYNLGYLRDQVGTARVRREKFEQETTIMRKRLSGCTSVAQIIHQGIFSVPGMTYDNEVLYFVEEYIPGETFADLLTRAGPLSPETALVLFRQVAEAILPIHKNDVAHRDVKGSNILVVPEGTGGLGVERVAFTDFGNSAVVGSRYTQVGSILYRSPEQLKGKGFPGGQKSDMWALGVLFYQALSGNYPFATLQPDWGSLSAAHVRHQKDQLRDQIAHGKIPLPFPHPTRDLEFHLNAVIVGRPSKSTTPIALTHRDSKYLLSNKHPYLLDRRRERRSNANAFVKRLRALERIYRG